MTGILIGILMTIHVIVCILLLLIVLMQRPRSEGLGTAFGASVTDTLFGSSTGNVLTKITTWLGTIVFLTTITLGWLYSHSTTGSTGSSDLKSRIKNTPTPETTATATNSAATAIVKPSTWTGATTNTVAK